MRKVVRLGVTHDELFQGEMAGHIPYHRMYGKEYCLPSFALYSPEEVRRIAMAAERVNGLYEKALRFAQRYLPDGFLRDRLGIPEALLAAARVEVPIHGVSRQDWILNGDMLKCIENNTDTPSGVPEAAWLSEAMITKYGEGAGNPNAEMRDRIQSAFRRLLEYYRGQGLTGRIAFCCSDWHTEDKYNTLYILNAVAELGYEADFVPLEQLQIVPGDGLFAGERRIDILYRLYPLEYLVHDREESTEFPVGEELIRLVEAGKLGLINPAQSIITQSKGFMALLWSLYERNEQTEEALGFALFSREECEAVETYLLPTYFEDSVFRTTGEAYVSKGYWGREGKGVTLYDSGGAEVPGTVGTGDETDPEVDAYYRNQPKVYQRRCRMEAAEVQTETGVFSGYVLTGVYVIGGRFAGLLPRIGEPVTGDMAYFCPAAMENKEDG